MSLTPLNIIIWHVTTYCHDGIRKQFMLECTAVNISKILISAKFTTKENVDVSPEYKLLIEIIELFGFS